MQLSTAAWFMPNLLPIVVSVSVVCSIRSCCCLNSIIVASKNLDGSPLAAQRANIEAAAAFTSSGNSRETKRTIPASIYFDCSMGKTFSANAAQCEQVREEYSTMVIGALAEPSVMSDSATGLLSSAAISFAAAPTVERTTASTAASKDAANAARRGNGKLKFLRFRHPRARYDAGAVPKD